LVGGVEAKHRPTATLVTNATVNGYNHNGSAEPRKAAVATLAAIA
jgi:hypothetical protein